MKIKSLKTSQRDVAVLIAISANGGITRSLPAIISEIASGSMNLRMVVDLNSEEIVYKNPKWEYLAEQKPTEYYHYQTWVVNGQIIGMALNAEETEVLDEILNWDFIGEDYYDELEEEFYAKCK